MNKQLPLIGFGVLVLGLAVATPSDALAGLCDWFPIVCGGGNVGQAPEIDPGMLSATISLLSGGVLMLVDRRRRR
jgi:hypothetical protein